MAKKWKDKARIANLQASRTVSTKRQKLTPVVWDLLDAQEERISDDEIVTYDLSSFNTLQIHEIVFQVGNASNKEQPSQNTFHIAVDLKGSLLAAPSQGSSHFEWSIITDPIDVNGPKDADDKIGTGSSTEPESSDEERDALGTPQPPAPISPGPLKGHKYAPPTQSNAVAALKELKTVLCPHHDTGRDDKDPELDLWCRA